MSKSFIYEKHIIMLNDISYINRELAFNNEFKPYVLVRIHLKSGSHIDFKRTKLKSANQILNELITILRRL